MAMTRQSAPTEFSHKELSLLLFALEGGTAGDEAAQSPPSCEEACPVIDDLQSVFGGAALSHEKRLAHHLNRHLQEALIECGMLDLMEAMGRREPRPLSTEDQKKFERVNERLGSWACELKLEETDRRLLKQAISQLPRSAWLTMPRTLWRLRKKLKSR